MSDVAIPTMFSFEVDHFVRVKLIWSNDSFIRIQSGNIAENHYMYRLELLINQICARPRPMVWIISDANV